MILAICSRKKLRRKSDGWVIPQCTSGLSQPLSHPARNTIQLFWRVFLAKWGWGWERRHATENGGGRPLRQRVNLCRIMQGMCWVWRACCKMKGVRWCSRLPLLSFPKHQTGIICSQTWTSDNLKKIKPEPQKYETGNSKRWNPGKKDETESGKRWTKPWKI